MIMLAHDSLRPSQKSLSVWTVSLRRVAVILVALEPRLTALGLGALGSGSDDVP